MVVILLLVVVLVVTGFAYAARHRPAQATAAGSVQVGTAPRPAMSGVGRWSLIALAGALLLRTTAVTLPIYYAAAIGGAAFVLAVVARLRYHDRSPALWLSLVLVPLAAAFSIAFVALQ